MLKDIDKKLLQAAKNMAYGQVKEYLEAGADVNARDPDTGMTPLHYAVSADVTDYVRDRVLEQILPRNPDVNARNTGGATPLHLAVPAAMRNARTNVMEKLISLGANSLLRDMEGKTPYDRAKEKEGNAMFYATVIGFLEDWEKKKPAERRDEEFQAANKRERDLAAKEAQEKLSAGSKKFKLKP